MSEYCAGYEFRSGRPCPYLAIETITAGCEHEHVGDRDLCARHIEDVRNGWMNCGDCAEVDGHECRLQVIERSRV